MARRTRYHHGDLPNALCAEALRLVRAHGAHSFSLRSAAREVGVDVSAVYRHYRDREALLRAVARVGFQTLAAAMTTPDPPPPSTLPLEGAETETQGGAETRFRAVGRAYVRFAVQDPELFRLMFGPLGAGGAGPLFEDGTSVAFAVLLTHLEALQAAGGCAWPLPDAATAAWSAVHGLATLLVDGPLPSAEADARITVVLDMVTAGLRASR